MNRNQIRIPVRNETGTAWSEMEARKAAMAIGFDKAFGIHEHAVAVRAYRASVLASNVANADTPHYNARDFDFRRVLRGVPGGTPVARTHQGHLSAGSMATGGVDLLYRVPNQASMDGNTVDPHIELANYMNNALRYQASLRFLDGKIKGLMRALRGE